MPRQSVHYVGFWIRLLAFLIDSTLATLAIAPLAGTIIGEIDLDPSDPDALLRLLADEVALAELLSHLRLQLIFDLVVMGTIFILFWMYRSSTPGKMLFGVYIVDAQTLGKTSARQNIIRYFGYFASMIPFFLGFLWIAFDQRKQGWHDKMAGTLVIKGKPIEPSVHANGEPQ
ncbi:MAG: RDD family protein [Proteobacteria bacterium]|jgi:uncharacterized RDD family membrane protein YckC|nr:RDD family protein [Pseudomonadota bacterium]MDA1302458.1 RDD family protein [Pseudomonadota bacterium]